MNDEHERASRGTGLRIFGVPVQFAIVVVVSAAVAIFFAAWAADARVEARSQTFASTGARQQVPSGYPGVNVPSLPVTLSSSLAAGPLQESEKELWESSVLFLCPLH